MGLVNLSSFDRFIEANHQAFKRYSQELDAVPGVRLLQFEPNNDPNYHYIVAEIESGAEVRDRLVEVLHAENVLARKYFWPGCHGMQTYSKFYPHSRLLLPHTERVADERYSCFPTAILFLRVPRKRLAA